MEVITGEVSVGLPAHHLLLRAEGREEAADAAALPAGVGHEEGSHDTHPAPRPGRAARVLVHTALPVVRTM